MIVFAGIHVLVVKRRGVGLIILSSVWMGLKAVDVMKRMRIAFENEVVV